MLLLKFIHILEQAKRLTDQGYNFKVSYFPKSKGSSPNDARGSTILFKYSYLLGWTEKMCSTFSLSDDYNVWLTKLIDMNNF